MKLQIHDAHALGVNASASGSLPTTATKTAYIYVNKEVYHAGDYIIVNTVAAVKIPEFMEV